MKYTALAFLLSSSVLVGVPALAQTNDANTTPAATGTASGSTASGNDFITTRQPDQFLASNIRGANVMSPQNENIGTVSDMIVGKDGRLAAITVDVGGFLGIGAKTVAIPAQGLEFVPVSATTANVASNSAAAPSGTAAPATGAGNAGADPAVTGSTTTDNSAGGGTMPSSNSVAALTESGSRLDHLMVQFTREQLQNAPEFND